MVDVHDRRQLRAVSEVLCEPGAQVVIEPHDLVLLCAMGGGMQ